MDTKATPPLAGDNQTATRFVEARLAARALPDFPGTIPDDLDTAYRTQDTAIELWPDSVAGWKVGRVPPAFEGRLGADRLAGPIFESAIVEDPGDGALPMPVFVGGFAAVEAEFVAVIGEDAPVDKLEWTLEEAGEMIGDLRIGLEIASSPLATINDLGPTVVVSDFGNNNGLIVGASIRDWQSRDANTLVCESFVDGLSVGTGGAFLLTGGYRRSVQFMLENAAARGRPLKAGTLIATGQTSGIHDVSPGQTARIRFGEDGVLDSVIVPAEPAA